MRSKKRQDRTTLPDLAGVTMQVKRFERREIIYSQGERGNTVLYIQDGGVKLSAVTETGKEAVVAILGPGDFVGEKCLSGWLVRGTTATATAPSTLIVIRKNEMRRVLLTKHPFCAVFISYLLARNLQTEEDLIDSLCNRSEVRLARVLLRLAEQGDHDKAHAFAEVSQATLARMIGTTRSRVNIFMNRFRKRGFIRYVGKYDGAVKRNDGLRINTSLLAAVLDK
jgi:CRP/FNR family transcriptional regulator, cyclic AMP receptor protein